MNEAEEKEYQEFQEYLKEWAYKKMQKLEKKLQRYAKMYFGWPVEIRYARDVTEGSVKVDDQEGWE